MSTRALWSDQLNERGSHQIGGCLNDLDWRLASQATDANSPQARELKPLFDLPKRITTRLSARLNERCLGQQWKHFVLLAVLFVSIPIFVIPILCP